MEGRKVEEYIEDNESFSSLSFTFSPNTKMLIEIPSDYELVETHVIKDYYYMYEPCYTIKQGYWMKRRLKYFSNGTTEETYILKNRTKETNAIHSPQYKSTTFNSASALIRSVIKETPNNNETLIHEFIGDTIIHRYILKHKFETGVELRICSMKMNNNERRFYNFNELRVKTKDHALITNLFNSLRSKDEKYTIVSGNSPIVQKLIKESENNIIKDNNKKKKHDKRENDNNNKQSKNNEDDIVKFNVGGVRFYFLRETICSKIKNPNYGMDNNNKDEYYEQTLLETLISSNIPVTMIDNDYIFIDRDPKLFHYIANYLRNCGSIDKYIVELPKEEEDLVKLKNEANYFGIQGLIDLIDRNYPFFTYSKIINTKQYQKLLNEWIDEDKNQYWNLIYQGSRDGFGAQDFHNLCDEKSPTITIIKSTSDHIFGGYTTSAWNENNGHNLSGYYSSPNAFLFSLNNPTKQDAKPMRFDLNGKHNNIAMGYDKYFGPSFGVDLCINNKCNSTERNFSHLGTAYGFNVSFEDMTGTKNFTVKEIEVFTKI
ncbi:hypothetical protein ABK040_001415 [Willaertia magna]